LLLHNILSSLYTPLRMIVQVLLFGILLVGVKLGLSTAMLIQDDAHLLEILKSKFTNFKSFNTQLYNCAKEFDFLGWQTPLDLSKTLLLPIAVSAGLAVIILYLKNTTFKYAQDKKKEIIQNTTIPSAGLCYNVLQTIAYTIMAILIMRLKLFLTPHLCVLAGLVASPALSSVVRGRECHIAVIVALLAAMSYQGFKNIEQQRMIMGEYSDPDLEELFDWVEKGTDKEAVFAGSMPLMANLMLSTERAVVNHPHFEDAGSRDRTKKVYSIFSRAKPQQVFDILKNMQVDYVILSHGWCLSVERDGCAMPELWDIQQPQNKHRPAVCPILWKNAHPFLRVFKNKSYAVLQLTNKIVQIKETNTKPR